MVKITLTAAADQFKAELKQEDVKHFSYIKGLMEAAPDCDAEIDVPHADAAIIQTIITFADQHSNDPEVNPEWTKEKPRELTEGDKANFAPHVGMALVNLLKAANFLGNQMLLNAAATRVGQVLVTKNEKEVQDYFGVHREITKEEADAVQAKYPIPFF
jgi:hypothetical protein